MSDFVNTTTTTTTTTTTNNNNNNSISNSKSINNSINNNNNHNIDEMSARPYAWPQGWRVLLHFGAETKSPMSKACRPSAIRAV